MDKYLRDFVYPAWINSNEHICNMIDGADEGLLKMIRQGCGHTGLQSLFSSVLKVVLKMCCMCSSTMRQYTCFYHTLFFFKGWYCAWEHMQNP